MGRWEGKKRAGFTTKIRGLEHWDHLCEDDLYPSNVERAGSSQFLEGFQERLGRKRYTDSGTGEVRAVLAVADYLIFVAPAICEIPGDFRILFDDPCTVFAPIISILTPSMPIVIMAIYIDKYFSARQHLLCQPDVSSTRVVFSWS